MSLPTAETGVGTCPQRADLERRFSGLRRLYGSEGYARIRAARVAVVGLGGVGSWAAEALARSGVAALVLIDLDHVAESNIQRQVQATGASLGMAKAAALALRIADIHPGCAVHCIEDFVGTDNWPALLPGPVDAVIDACDQVRAKTAIGAWALGAGTACVMVGAAGGKRLAQAVEIGDLADVTHDPLLAALRQRLRRDHGARRKGRLGLRCVFSREPVALPADAAQIPALMARQRTGAADSVDGVDDADAGIGDLPTALLGLNHSLNCHGYGSVVTVTSTFGMVAAGEVLALMAAAHALPLAAAQATPVVEASG